MALSLAAFSATAYNMPGARVGRIRMQETEVEAAKLSNAEAAEMTGVVVQLSKEAEPAAPPAASREIAWFPKNAKEMAPPVFSWRPMFKALGASPGDAAPAYLDGSMTGDMGFDPLGLVAMADPELSKDGIFKIDELARSKAKRMAKIKAMSPEEVAKSVAWMRDAEIKHARLAMLAAAGWVHAELYSPFQGAMSNGRAPSLFNGHLFDLGPLAFTALAFGGLGFLETQTKGKGTDLGFDPLGLGAKGLTVGPISKTADELALSELKNGRLAMMAITGYAVQEFVYGAPVTKTWGLFFPHPFGN